MNHSLFLFSTTAAAQCNTLFECMYYLHVSGVAALGQMAIAAVITINSEHGRDQCHGSDSQLDVRGAGVFSSPA